MPFLTTKNGISINVRKALPLSEKNLCRHFWNCHNYFFSLCAVAIWESQKQLKDCKDLQFQSKPNKQHKKYFSSFGISFIFQRPMAFLWQWSHANPLGSNKSCAITLSLRCTDHHLVFIRGNVVILSRRLHSIISDRSSCCNINRPKQQNFSSWWHSAMNLASTAPWDMSSPLHPVAEGKATLRVKLGDNGYTFISGFNKGSY